MSAALATVDVSAMMMREATVLFISKLFQFVFFYPITCLYLFVLTTN